MSITQKTLKENDTEDDIRFQVGVFSLSFFHLGFSFFRLQLCKNKFKRSQRPFFELENHLYKFKMNGFLVAPGTIWQSTEQAKQLPNTHAQIRAENNFCSSPS